MSELPPPLEQRLDARVIPWWIVSGLVATLVVSTILVAGTFVLTHKFPDATRLAWTGCAVAAALLVLYCAIEPPLAYARWRYAVTPELLLMRHGIVFHEEKIIPISRLQHVDLSRGPIERLFGLATLVVHTAGSEAASFRLPGLAHAHAQALRDTILASRGDDVV